MWCCMVAQEGGPLRCGHDAGSCAAAVRTSTGDAVRSSNTMQLMQHISLVAVMVCPAEGLKFRHVAETLNVGANVCCAACRP